MMNTYKKIFGVGPLGAFISLLIMGLTWFVDRRLGHPQIMTDPAPLRYVGLLFLVLGLSLHLWTMKTLRNWWSKDRLCVDGPFRYLRHPMYAAWVTFIIFGLAFALNSWIMVAGALLLHPIWHVLVRREERIVVGIFGDAYRRYAAGTGRFVPRVFWRFTTSESD